ncbi:MAG: hypothetical protein PHC56_07445 [Herbinix sp.]|nr:hypothetical protein [Herbinix sp.]
MKYLDIEYEILKNYVIGNNLHNSYNLVAFALDVEIIDCYNIHTAKKYGDIAKW